MYASTLHYEHLTRLVHQGICVALTPIEDATGWGVAWIAVHPDQETREAPANSRAMAACGIGLIAALRKHYMREDA